MLKPRPFWVSVHDGPSGKFLGLYVKAEVDWNNKIAATSGEEYAKILSQNEEGLDSFYSSASHFTPQETKPSVSCPTTKPSTAAPESTGNNLSRDKYNAILGLLKKMNLIIP